MSKPIHVYRTYVRGSVEQVWAAITDPDFTERYFYRTRLSAELAPGAPFRYLLPEGSEAVEGVIEVVEPLRRLTMTWRVLYDAAMSEEPPSRVEWTLTPGDGVTLITLIHRDLGRSPHTSGSVELGWLWVLDGLKTVVETGAPLGASVPGDGQADAAVAAAIEDEVAAAHRRAAIEANNATWELLDGRPLDADAVDDLLGRAYAALHHWRRAQGAGPENAARASWLVARAHAVAGHGDLALHHAEQAIAVVAANGLEDFDRAYAHEARARALACLGRDDEARVERELAAAVPIADPEDAAIVAADLAAAPWFGLTGLTGLTGTADR